MRIVYDKKNLVIKRAFIIIFYFFLVIVAKVVRYTVMKESLVDASIGHEMLEDIINSEHLKFSISSEESMATTNASTFFKIINIFNFNTYIQFEIYITIIWNLILLVILLGIKKELSLGQGLLVILTILVSNIFNFNLAKEPIQMLYFIVIYYIIISSNISIKKKFILSLLVILFSAVTYRLYYLLIIFFTICVYFLCNIFIINKKKVKFQDILLLIAFIGLAYYILLNIAKIILPEQYSELLRVRLRVGEATSNMTTIIPGSSTNLVLFIIDYLLMIIRMLIPIELCSLGVKYFAFVIYQILITYFLIRALKSIRTNEKYKNYALFIFIGFILASATFEPDFGSWVRHEAVTAPIIFIIADIKKQKEKGQVQNEKNIENT